MRRNNVVRYRRSAKPHTKHLRAVVIGALVGGLTAQGLLAERGSIIPAVQPTGATFGLCYTGGGTNCVVDGDTFWIGGEKVRIADIDAPETHPPRCADEADLGERATVRLQALLNEGPVTLAPADRDTDRYGRHLRIVARDGRSLGDQLVGEGLARRWTGRRQPWCDT